MPKPRDLAEERRRHAKAARARKVLDLMRRGYTEADAEKVVSSMNSIKFTRDLLRLTARLDIGKSTEQELLERTTIEEVLETLEIVNKYEPEKVKLLMPVVRRYQQNKITK